MPYPSSYVSWDGISSGAVVEYGRDNLTSYKTLMEISGPKWVLILKSVMFTASVLSAGKLHPKSLQHSLVYSNHCYLMVRIRIKVKGEGRLQEVPDILSPLERKNKGPAHIKRSPVSSS